MYEPSNHPDYDLNGITADTRVTLALKKQEGCYAIK